MSDARPLPFESTLQPTVVRPQVPGLSLHALDWNPGGAPPILFVHGWMDHARGFDPVIEALPRAWRPLALDLRGHGQSDHLPPGSHYHFTDYLRDVELTLDFLGLAQAHLVGHSMGGAVCLGYAAARPERVLSLGLIENLGTLGGLPEDALRRLKVFLDDARKPLRKRTYASLEEAVARVQENNPGLSEAGAWHMTRHGTRPADGGVQFTVDPRIRHQSGMGFDEAQLLAVLRAVRSPVQVIRGAQGYSLPEEAWGPRLEALRQPEVLTVEGGHHVHLDRPEEVAGHLERFIAKVSQG